MPSMKIMRHTKNIEIEIIIAIIKNEFKIVFLDRIHIAGYALP